MHEKGCNYFVLQGLQTDMDGNYNLGGSGNKQARTEKVGGGMDSTTTLRRSPLNLANLKSYGNIRIQ